METIFPQGLGAPARGAPPVGGLGAKPPGGGQMYQDDDDDDEEGSTETDDEDDDGSGGAVEGYVVKRISPSYEDFVKLQNPGQRASQFLF